jgi:WhiB family redox-sensing transcriptional regulator
MVAAWDPWLEAGVALSAGGVPLDEVWDLDVYWPAPGPPAWQADALCREYGLALFFAADPTPARAVCARCLVTEECLAFALAAGVRYGVFGGLTAEERRSRKVASYRRAARTRRLLEEEA